MTRYFQIKPRIIYYHFHDSMECFEVKIPVNLIWILISFSTIFLWWNVFNRNVDFSFYTLLLIESNQHLSRNFPFVSIQSKSREFAWWELMVLKSFFYSTKFELPTKAPLINFSCTFLIVIRESLTVGVSWLNSQRFVQYPANFHGSWKNVFLSTNFTFFLAIILKSFILLYQKFTQNLWSRKPIEGFLVKFQDLPSIDYAVYIFDIINSFLVYHKNIYMVSFQLVHTWYF